MYTPHAEKSSEKRFISKNITKFGIAGTRLPAPAAYALSLAAGFVFGYGLYAVISRIPYYRWAVLGISEEKKDVQG